MIRHAKSVATSSSDDTCGSDCSSDSDFSLSNIFGCSGAAKRLKISNDDAYEQNETFKCAENEVQSYLLASRGVSVKTNIFDWWNNNKTNFPNVAALARKWLACPATSVASERVFSSCGLVQTAKRSRLLGKTIQDQVMIHKNLQSLSFSLDDVIAKW